MKFSVRASSVKATPAAGLLPVENSEGRLLPMVKATLAAGLLLVAQITSAATVTVVISKLESDRGTLNIRVYDSSRNWLEDDGMLTAQALVVADHHRDGVISTTIELEPGEYAIYVHHDDNGNGKMDTRIFPPIPREPVGTSNDAEPGFGPPRYRDAKFEVGEEGLTMPVSLMRY